MDERELRLCSAEELNIEKTFECGQCFRWNADENRVYTGVAMGFPARVREEGGEVYIRSAAPGALWRDYFDLGRDYAEISAGFRGGEYLAACAENGRGIRILRQEPWEALCSFIISQCNNITRIKGIVERLCALCGESTDFDGERFYLFPPAETVAALTIDELAPLRCGYRAPHILAAAREVASGALDLGALERCPGEEAKRRLKELDGVGDKVANCAILFGLHHMEAFPIDVWMRRALKEHFPPDFDPASLGDYAGLAQQYIFFAARGEGR